MPTDKYERNRVRRQRAVEPSARGVFGRDLPHSVELEQRLLAVCLLDGSDTICRCLREGLTAQDFFMPAAGVVYEVLVDLHAAHGFVDVAMVCERLQAEGRLGEIGGYPYLAEFSQYVPTSAGAPVYIQRLQELARRRKKILAAGRALEAYYEGDAEAVESAESSLRDLSAAGAGRLPAILRWEDFVGKEPRALPPELVKGVLHRGAKMMIAGGSKSFKTWVLLDLGLSVATGTPWWGFKTERADVLYLNMEIMVEFCEERVRAISKAKGIEGAAGFHSWHLRGYARDFKELLPQMVRAIAGAKYGLIILDPVYKVLGERDENANGEVAALLNEFESLAVQTGAAIAYGHHHSKGNQGEKDARDRSSGAGAWTRDPDALLDLTPHAEEEHFTATFTLRNLAPRAPMVVKWNFPCMSTAPGMNPADLRKPGRPTEHGVGDVVELLGSEGMTYGEWERAAAKKKISESSFKRLLARATEQGLVAKNGPIYRRKM
jgi:hypothetical protein